MNYPVVRSVASGVTRVAGGKETSAKDRRQEETAQTAPVVETDSILPAPFRANWSKAAGASLYQKVQDLAAENGESQIPLPGKLSPGEEREAGIGKSVDTYA